MSNHSIINTWVLEKLPPGKKAIGSRWVFHIKRNADGTVEQFRARIVAKGYNQHPGFDYMETEYVCRLNKSICGLKQAARLWNKELHPALLDM